jgi:uncharacterized protein (TIGR00369 family)
VNRVLDAIPYARFLGVTVDRTGGTLECVLPFREELIGNVMLRAIHGGVIGAFLELTAILHLVDDRGTDRVPKPINFAIDYLRSAAATDTRARADIFKFGRRVAVVHVVAWQDDPKRPVAFGNGKFLY